MKDKTELLLGKLDALTEAMKKTPLGQEVLKEMDNQPPIESWIDDIDENGKLIGRLKMFSRKYVSFKDQKEPTRF